MRLVLSPRAILLTLLMAVGMFVANPSLAQRAPSEYELKAAFVYQFLSYVTWPEEKLDADDTIVIGVAGAPEVAENLATLSSAQGNSRKIDVQVIALNNVPEGLHVMFLAEEFTDEGNELLEAAASNAVLTITERLPRPQNSIINFEIIDNKVRFDIGLGLARQNGLDISGRLLQVALRVLDQP